MRANCDRCGRLYSQHGTVEASQWHRSPLAVAASPFAHSECAVCAQKRQAALLQRHACGALHQHGLAHPLSPPITTPHRRPPSPPTDLTQEGPYGVMVLHDNLRIEQPDRPSRPARLGVTVSAPAVAPSEPPLPGPPFPVVLMMNGFQGRASQYAPFARRLASWGFMVVQVRARVGVCVWLYALGLCFGCSLYCVACC